MVKKSKLPLGIAATVVLVALFSIVFIRYSLKSDPTTIDHVKRDDAEEPEIIVIDDDSMSDSDMGYIFDEDPSFTVTQSTAVTNNRRTTTVTTTTAPVTTTKSTTTTNRPTTTTRRVTTRATTKATTRATTKASTSVTTTKPANSDQAKKLAAELDAAKTECRKAQDAYDNAKSDKESAQKALDSAQSAYNDAKSSYEAGKSEYETARSGAFGYFEAMDAKDALSVLNNSGSTHKGEEKDATSLENMKKALELMKTCNDIRSDEGKEELYVSNKLMALAMVNANYNVRNDGNTSGVFSNISKGNDDPYKVWYDDQRKPKGENYRALISDEYTGMGYGISSDKNVHCLLLAKDSDDVGGLYNYSDYVAMFNDYYEYAISVPDPSGFEAEMNDAKKALDEAQKALSDKEEAYAAAKSAYEKASEALDNKQKEYNTLLGA